ncbi:MAG TPA: LLM class flavin-dependent oxidoreductase [Anaerolineae bacterium]|nr:LLM class flavin-dependent oxidoreductase [Anaerolineae bacterium]
MTELVRPVGLGLASRGSVSDMIEWADKARRKGLHSIWLHDSLFERDAVTYASAIASHVPDLRIALGALSSYTRHPVLTSMTISALDDMAPGRIILGMGTALPLRLAQMGIPYTSDQGVESVSKAIDVMRTMWAGQRIPSATPNLPPIQPMFPPVHHVPIFIAAYRTDFLKLAGAKADGYLARPAESIPNMKRLLAKLRKASLEAGRPEDAVTTAGYLLTHVDKSRREALNRAKREPFVIYMMSVLSNFSLEQAGFEPELRDRIAAAWRAEDYHRAAEMIPDEMLDAFMLVGTRDEVAEAAQRYHDSGMNIPIIQPVLQEDDQIDAVLDAAALYGSVAVAKPAEPAAEAIAVAASPESASAVGRLSIAAAARLDEDRLNPFEKAWRRLSAWYEVCRPFSLTASSVPVWTAGAIALIEGSFNLSLFLAAWLGATFLHLGTNIINEIYDVRHGIDTITSPRASLALLKGRVKEREAFALATAFFTLATAIGAGLILARGWPVVLFGALGLLGGWGYTAPPLQLKYRALGVPLVFLLMGPLMVTGAYYVMTGEISAVALTASIPVGFLVAAILHGNEWRDITDDARYGIGTLSTLVGRRTAHYGYVALIVGAYLALAIAVLIGALPTSALLAMLSMPLLVRAIRASELGAMGQQRAIAKIDLETAQLHATFGVLLVIGLALPGVVA